MFDINTDLFERMYRLLTGEFAHGLYLSILKTPVKTLDFHDRASLIFNRASEYGTVEVNMYM